MELQSIKKIVEAERKAEEIKKEADSNAKRIIEDAKNSGDKFNKQFNAKVESDLKELEESEKAKNAQKISKIQDDTSEKLKQLKLQFDENCEKAVNEIFKIVVNC